MQSPANPSTLRLSLLPAALSLCARAAPGWIPGWALLLLLQGLLPVALVLLSRNFVDALVEASPLLTLALALGSVLLSMELLKCLQRWINAAVSERVHDHVKLLIHRTTLRCDLEKFEHPAFFDRLHRATTEAAPRSVALLEGLGGLIRCSITLVSMMLVLLPYAAWLPLALLGSTAPAWFVVYRNAAARHRWWHDHTEAERRSRYFDWLLSHPEAAAEVRLFGLGERLLASWRQVRLSLRSSSLALERRQALLECLVTLLGLAFAAAAAAFMILRVRAGSFSLGDLALLLQTLYHGQAMMRMLSRQVGQLYQNILFLESLFAYLEQTPRITAPLQPQPIPDRIEHLRFDGITFRYPGSEAPVLSGFDFELEGGRITALVGPNGAGKSTLIKLLCRLHDPEAGSIRVNGTALTEFDPAAWQRQVSVLFQHPLAFHASVDDNIALGTPTAEPSAEAIAQAIQLAGAEELVDGLPQGRATLLGKEFVGGHQLSGGEWQRIALARAFLREAPLLLLDEPTSAMDTWAEQAWLDRVRAWAQGRTTLLITHRFTTARIADRICVIQNGRLVESGSHEELMQRNGPYATAWQRH